MFWCAQMLHMRQQKENSSGGTNWLNRFFPTAADKPCIRPVKIKLLFNNLHLKPTGSLRVGLWSPLSLKRRKTLPTALPSVFRFRSHISPLGKNKTQGKTAKHLSYTIFFRARYHVTQKKSLFCCFVLHFEFYFL